MGVSAGIRGFRVIVCSLNEVEIYGRRAARGAGMPWGLAEEAGKASRWLAERGLPGVALLARLLEANDGRSYQDMAPVIANGQWQASNGALCPVCTGAALSDHVDLLVSGNPISFSKLDYPLLLAPFLDCSWHRGDLCFQLRWADTRLLVFAESLAIESGQDAAHLVDNVDEVTVTACSKNDAGRVFRPRLGGVRISRAVWRQIEALAKRTYVPASEESRARGAGAGRTDND